MIAAAFAMLLAAQPATRPRPVRPTRAAPSVRPARIVLPILDPATECARDKGAIGCADRVSARYRLPLAQERAPTSKDRAMAETGQECQLVGAKMCTSNGRKVLSQPLNNATQP